MIDRLTGRLLAVRPQSVVLDPGLGAEGSVHIEVYTPVYWAQTLAGEIGRTVHAHTKVVLESQNQGAAFTPRLLGFPTEADRAFFDLFTSVKGLGQRKALKALVAEPPSIAAWITARDAKALQKLPEIGKRLAETIIAELHGKLGSLAVSAEMNAGLSAGLPEPKPVPQGPAADAVSALVALGQTRPDAEDAVSRALATLEPDTTPTADQLIGLAFTQR